MNAVHQGQIIADNAIRCPNCKSLAGMNINLVASVRWWRDKYVRRKYVSSGEIVRVDGKCPLCGAVIPDRASRRNDSSV